MGHSGNIKARYTTNKGILPGSQIQEMHDSYKRSESLLDLERTKEDLIIKQKDQVQNTIQQATPKQLGTILEMFQKPSIGKMCQARWFYTIHLSPSFCYDRILP